MAITKCIKCGTNLRIGTEQVGVDKDNLPIFHRFGYCDKCMLKYDIDMPTSQNKYMSTAPTIKKRKFNWSLLLIVILIFYVISISNNSKDKNDTKTNNSASQTNTSDISTEQTNVLSEKEEFSNNMDMSSDYINHETAENLYTFLKNDLLFERIKFDGKNSVGDILFDITADNYQLMISIDDDGIYSIRCGSYELYDGENILITKTGLDDRNLDYKSEYYIIAQEIIKQNLKSPKSADFPSLWSDEVKMQRNADIVAVQSYVDAQNSFGAMIRSEWLVEFKVVDIDTYSYEIIYINIDGAKTGEYIELN